MLNVKPIDVKNEPKEDLIQICRDLLEDAESGKMRGLAVVWTTTDKNGVDCYRVCRGQVWFTALIGGMYILQQTMAQELLNDV